MGTHVETFTARRASTRVWVIAGAVVLLLAALGGGVAIGRATIEEPEPSPLAPASDWTATIDELTTAWSSGDAGSVGAFYAEDAVLTSDADLYEGRDRIMDALSSANTLGDFSVERISDVVVHENVAAYLVRFGGSGGWEGMTGISVLEFDPEGKIVHQWSYTGPA